MFVKNNNKIFRPSILVSTEKTEKLYCWVWHTLASNLFMIKLNIR